jgi:hypothetical protein
MKDSIADRYLLARPRLVVIHHEPDEMPSK